MSCDYAFAAVYVKNHKTLQRRPCRCLGHATQRLSGDPFVDQDREVAAGQPPPIGTDTTYLCVVDAEGKHEPVRVTYTPGFDGLPVPSPDGRQLAWTSARSGAGAGQIFLAQWNHDKALEALRAAPPRRGGR